MKNKSQNNKSDFNLKMIKRRVICEAAAMAMLVRANASKNQTLNLIAG